VLRDDADARVQRLFSEATGEFFQALRVRVFGRYELPPGFAVLVIESGAGEMRWDGGDVTVHKGETWVVPHGAGTLAITGDLRLLVCLPPVVSPKRAQAEPPRGARPPVAWRARVPPGRRGAAPGRRGAAPGRRGAECRPDGPRPARGANAARWAPPAHGARVPRPTHRGTRSYVGGRGRSAPGIGRRGVRARRARWLDGRTYPGPLDDPRAAAMRILLSTGSGSWPVTKSTVEASRIRRSVARLWVPHARRRGTLVASDLDAPHQCVWRWPGWIETLLRRSRRSP
jgi:hypothetical protein